MKKLLTIALMFALVACGSKENKEWVVEVSNPIETDRPDEAVILTRAQLKPADDKLIPAVVDETGVYVASQVDDLNGDGKWDELAFVTDLAASQTKNLKIVWLDPAEYPEFTIRTNVRYARKLTRDTPITELKTDVIYKDLQQTIKDQGFYPFQMDGMAWENDKVGFRHYFDGRNCRDYYGKRVTDMVLDTVGIKPNGFPGDTYHVWAEWGRDIMSVGPSFGLGGLGAWVDGERFGRLGRLASEKTDNIDSTKYTLLTEGPVRSVFAQDFYGWEIEDYKMDSMRQVVSIWAGKHNYENKVILYKPLPENIKLVTGIARPFNDMPLEEIDFNKYIAMATHDYQSYNKEFIFGMGVILPKANVTRLFDTPDRGRGLTITWCAELEVSPSNETVFYPYGAWEHQDTLFRSRDYFMDFIRKEGGRLDNPVGVTLK